jgi:hypothetical protein
VNIRGTFSAHSGNLQCTFREDSGDIQGTLREKKKQILQGTFRAHSGPVQGKSVYIADVDDQFVCPGGPEPINIRECYDENGKTDVKRGQK